MSDTVNNSIRTLNDCGCCQGRTVQTPATLHNRPGLNVIAYRVGDHAGFKQSMLSRLSSSDYPRLSDLKTRDEDDFSIALLDAWATVADVLTFYMERIFNQSYMRVCTERLSLLQLARLIGYELRPGVAASTYLAFTLEEAIGAPEQATKRTSVPVGTMIQSTPGPDEQAQTYETVEQIEARVEWNAMRPRLTQPQMVLTGMGSVILQGIATNLKRGDLVLIVQDDSNRKTRRIMDIKTDVEAKITRIDFDNPGLSPAAYIKPTIPPEKPGAQGNINDFAPNTELTGEVIRKIVKKTWRAEDLSALAEFEGWSEQTLVLTIDTFMSTALSHEDSGIYIFRRRASAFGYNAPMKVTYPETYPHLPDFVEWEPSDEENEVVFLDNAYEEILPNSYVSILTQGESEFQTYIIQDAKIQSRTEYSISSNTTRLELDGEWWDLDMADIRESTFYVQSKRMTLTEIPVEDFVEGDCIVLGRVYLGLKSGNPIVLTGERSDLPDSIESEVVTLKDVWIDGGHTVLVFKESLAHSYDRKTVTLNANIAPATHGESTHEILGSGDAGQPNQRFTLRQPPLTHISAETPNGTEPTLEVRVNDVLWHEVESFFKHGSNERIYITRTDDQGRTTVQFGDGINGARLPSGQNNVRARYRKGIGLEGKVKARQLNQLMTRPLGVREVVNPIAAGGADDPESLDNARANAPLTVMTLDRTVSLKDYEDFARAFAGIAKTQAIRIWDGKVQCVYITVAGPGGEIVKPGSSTYKKLSGALQKAGDPYVNFTVKSFQPAFFRVEGGIHVDPDHLPDKVLVKVKDSLREHYSFEKRDFAQPVMLSEVLALIQAVYGVAAVDIDKLYRVEDDVPGLNPRLPASGSSPDENKEMLAAELLTLDPSPLDGLKVLS